MFLNINYILFQIIILHFINSKDDNFFSYSIIKIYADNISTIKINNELQNINKMLIKKDDKYFELKAYLLEGDNIEIIGENKIEKGLISNIEFYPSYSKNPIIFPTTNYWYCLNKKGYNTYPMSYYKLNDNKILKNFSKRTYVINGIENDLKFDCSFTIPRDDDL